MRFLIFFSLLTIAAAIPVRNGTNNTSPPPARNDIEITPEIILAVSPDSAKCPKTGQFSSECRTATEAAPFVSESFNEFNITTNPEAAAVLSLMLFESGGFKFNIHHFPSDNPGQGTRNMMSFPFILEYAHDVLPAGDDDIPPVGSTNVSDAEKNEVLAKVLGDKFSFATGAWFYQKKCDDKTKQGVKNGTEAGWRQYIEKCVGTTVTDDRLGGWNKALKALNG